MEINTPIPETIPPVAEKSYFLYLFIALILLGIFFLGGTYMIIHFQKSYAIPSAAVKNTTVENQKEFTDMESQLEETKPQDIETDFTQVDQEMKNL